MSVDSTERLVPRIYSQYLAERFGRFVPFQFCSNERYRYWGWVGGLLATTFIRVEPSKKEENFNP